MGNRKYDNFLFYSAPDDPRLYIYQYLFGRRSGVTLNFGHPRAWRVFWIIMGVSMLPVVTFAIVMVWAKETGRLADVVMPAGLGLGAMYAILTLVLTIHCFRAAERDLRQYGETRPGVPLPLTPPSHLKGVSRAHGGDHQ